MFYCKVFEGGHFNIIAILQQRCNNISQPPRNVTMLQCNVYAIFLQHFCDAWEITDELMSEDKKGVKSISNYVQLTN